MATPGLSPNRSYPCPGEFLKARRQELGLSLRDVRIASLKIAADEGNEEFAISIGRLSAIETQHVVPGIYRLASLAKIYGLNILTILAMFGVQEGRDGDVT